MSTARTGLLGRAGSPVFRRTGPPVLGPDGEAAVGPVLVVRPHRVLVAAWISAVAVVAVFTVVAVLLRSRNTGVYFRFADQVAMVVLGILIAAGVLLLARPRVRADARGIEVRNVGTPRYLPWEQVRAVSFPDGASWARLDLPYYEYVAVMAVQAVDGERAVAAMRRLRALHAAAQPPERPPPDGRPPGGKPSGGARSVDRAHPEPPEPPEPGSDGDPEDRT